MNESTVINTRLEQALYTSVGREKTLRIRVSLAMLLPLLAGGAWLAYSSSHLKAVETRNHQLEDHEAVREDHEAELKAQIARIDSARIAAEKRALSAEGAQKAALTKTDAANAALLKVRGELEHLEVAVTDLMALRTKVAKLNNSEPSESQIMAIRSNLSKGLSDAQKQIAAALPNAESKPKVRVFVSDESQRQTVQQQLKPKLETSGFEVDTIVKKDAPHKAEATEVRVSARDPQAKSEALRIQNILEEGPGKSDCRLSYADDIASTPGEGGIQIWLKKERPGFH